MDIISGTCRFGFCYLISVFFFPHCLRKKVFLLIMEGREVTFLLSSWRTQPRKVQIIVLKCSNRACLKTSLPFPPHGTELRMNR